MKTNEFDCVSVHLFSHQLNEPYRSFDTTLTVKDFKKSLYWTIAKAKKVVYVNPKGEELRLK